MRRFVVLKGEPIVVVGAGATGIASAFELTRLGLRVVLVDAGPHYEATPEESSESALCDPGRTIQRSCGKFNTEPLAFIRDDDYPYTTPAAGEFFWIRSRQLGGRLQVWARCAPRFTDYDFETWKWPVRAADLESDYATVERLLRVVNPTRQEGEGSKAVLGSSGVDSGLPNLEMPEGRVRTVPQPVATRDIRDIFAEAMATGLLTYRANTAVSRLVVTAGGSKLGGVLAVDTQRRTDVVIPASAVVLCASAFETTRILLHTHSVSGGGPLLDESGFLGRSLSDHVHGPEAFFGRIDDPGATVTSIFLQLIPDAARAVGRAWLQGTLHEKGGAIVGLEGHTRIEVLPNDANRLTIGVLRDRWGIPVPNIALRYGASEYRSLEFVLEALQGLTDECGLETINMTGVRPPGLSCHEVGGARMGASPTTSVTDPSGALWANSRIVVGDGASFCSSGSANPTLTMMALAIRASRLLAERLGSD